jgi:antitoxin VapB
MALNLKNPEVERLVNEVAELAGESKTEAVRQALLERRQRLTNRQSTASREARILRFLETEVWPRVPEGQLGRRLTEAEEDDILGYGEHGV